MTADELARLLAVDVVVRRPDLVVVPRSGPALPVAIEVEGTVNGARRLLAICARWAGCRHVAVVRDYATYDVAAVTRAAMRATSWKSPRSLRPWRPAVSASTPNPDGAEGLPRLDTPLLSPRDAAELLAVKPSWIYDAVRAGTLPCLRLGRHIRFTRPMLEDWLRSRVA